MSNWTQADLDRHNARMRKGKAPEEETAPEPTDEPVFRSEWEAQYAGELEIRRLAGDIIEWHHEPIKLKLYTTIERGKRKSVYYIPDFMILHNDGKTEMVEVKGYEREVGRLKYLKAVEKFRHFTWRKVSRENDNWIDIHYKGFKIDTTV